MIGDSQIGNGAPVAWIAPIQTSANTCADHGAGSPRPSSSRRRPRRRLPLELPSGQRGDEELGVEQHPDRRQQQRVEELDERAADQAAAPP
jgi:hypothetical protein